MVYMFDGVAWVSPGGHFIAVIYQQQPHMYHKEEKEHWVDVPFGIEDLHTFCSTYSKRSMVDDMATMVQHWFFLEVSLETVWMPYDDDFQLITYEVIWASIFHNVGEEIFGDLVFILPMEGNIIAA